MRHEHAIIELVGNEWRNNAEDRDGGFGVAIMLSFIVDGVRAKIDEMARHLGESIPDIGMAFERLKDAGYFTNEFDVKNDPALTYKNSEVFEISGVCAWGHVAGIASGILYRPFSSLPLVEKLSRIKKGN
jgi:hypothetical protein